MSSPQHRPLTPFTLAALRKIYQSPATVELSADELARVAASQALVERITLRGDAAYGINTGFGLMAQTRIPVAQLGRLQKNLLLSHAAGLGTPLPDPVVRLILALKIKSLAQGYSGISLALIDALRALLEHEVYPLIPSQGSVGASGDLAPLAHMSAVLLGVGEVRHRGNILSAAEGLRLAGLAPRELRPKEGLALINGTQVSTALALAGLFGAEDLFAASIIAGAMSVDALKGSDAPFDARVHAVRGQRGQIEVARVYLDLLRGSQIRDSHRECARVQDPYSFRCQPQVMGACLDLIRCCAQTLAIEANAVTDNPLLFADDGAVISGGNFHAEPVAFAADTLALAIAEIGSLSERRIAVLVDPKMSGLPAFLVENSGLNSGFMIMQVTAAALVAENKTRATPASVDSIPTSANQEDHVSMATHAAYRLDAMVRNAAGVVGVELLAAAQGIDFHRPSRSSTALETVHAGIRAQVAHLDADRYVAPDIEFAQRSVLSGQFAAPVQSLIPLAPAMNPFEFAAGRIPLLVSFPHSGTFIPEALRPRLTDAALRLPDTDWHVPQLYSFARAMGAATLTATHSRYVVDLNRPDDGAALYPGQRETAVCPVETFARESLYRVGEQPDADEIARRLNAYWRPYHQRLENAIAAIRAEHGHCILWDAHSIRSQVPVFFQGRLPDLNVGTADGRSCCSVRASRIERRLQAQHRFSFVMNGRFKGGYITRRYGAPERGIDAIQMEIAQRAYMSEDGVATYEPEAARDLQAELRALLECVAAHHPG